MLNTTSKKMDERDSLAVITENKLPTLIKNLNIKNTSLTPKNILKIYMQDSIFNKIGKKNGLNMREMTYFMINYITQFDAGQYKCKVCFEQTEKKILELYKFLDCDGNGFIAASELFHGVFFYKIIKFSLKN